MLSNKYVFKKGKEGGNKREKGNLKKKRKEKYSKCDYTRMIRCQRQMKVVEHVPTMYKASSSHTHMPHPTPCCSALLGLALINPEHH